MLVLKAVHLNTAYKRIYLKNPVTFHYDICLTYGYLEYNNLELRCKPRTSSQLSHSCLLIRTGPIPNVPFPLP